MESASFAVKRMHIVRVDPGEDVLAAVRKFIAESKVKQAVVLGGYGTLAAYRLHWVVDNRLPSRSTFGQGEGGIEILGMNGLVVEGEPHIHVSLSTPGGAYGGHLEDGCIAYVLCELMFAEVSGPTLARERGDVNVPSMGRGQVPRLVFGKSKSKRRGKDYD